MLRSDNILIVFILSLICGAIFSLAFIDIAYCDNTSFNHINNFSGTFPEPYNVTDFKIETTEESFTVLSTHGLGYLNHVGFTLSENSFYENFYTYNDDEGWIQRFSDAQSLYRTFTYHGLSYDYYWLGNSAYISTYVGGYSSNDLRITSGNGATADFSNIPLTDGLTTIDYIYLVWHGIINDDNFNFPEGYYIPDNVQIVEATDTMSSAYDSNKAITCTIAIPNTTHASYLNVKNVKVGYNNILAYLKYNFSFSSIFAKKFTFYDVDINPSFNNQEDNIKLLEDNVKYEKYYCELPHFIIDDLQNPLYMAVENYDINVPENVDSIQMPYDNQGNKNVAFKQYKRNNTNLSDYIYPNLPTSKTISFDCTLSDANLNKESDTFTITAMFDDDGKLSSVYYSGGTNPNGTEVKPQSYSASQNYNNLISKNDSEQGNQNNEDLTEDAEEEGKTLVTNTNDWNDINIDNVGFKGTLTSLFDMIKETLPFLQTIMFFVPSWVFALMALVLATVVIMRILGR